MPYVPSLTPTPSQARTVGVPAVVAVAASRLVCTDPISLSTSTLNVPSTEGTTVAVVSCARSFACGLNAVGVAETEIMDDCTGTTVRGAKGDPIRAAAMSVETTNTYTKPYSVAP